MRPRHFLAAVAVSSLPAFAADPPEPKFRAVTIDDRIQIGYGVAVADVDGDGKPDVLLADKKQFVWYRNPGGAGLADPGSWKKFILAENLTEKDNVCLAAQDLDGDGKCEIAVGGEWNPGDTEKSGAVFYLIPPADRTQRWEPVRFPNVEPTTHRMRWLKLNGEKWGLVVVPLHGRGNKNGEGAPVKVLCYIKPADMRSEWKAEVVDESMHMTHNFAIAEKTRGDGISEIIIGGREGLRWAKRMAAWKSENFDPVPKLAGSDFKGVGEVQNGEQGRSVIATIEPMHGNQLVAYTMSADGSGPGGMERRVLMDSMGDGHALACGDVLGINQSQIVVGWRGNPKQPQPVGIKLFTPLSGDQFVEKWRESLIDDNGMACEDLVLADLNADGKLDIVAAGRATKNVKIYFNETLR